MTADPIKPAPPVTSSFMVGSFTDEDKLATDGADFHGRKDKNKAFFVGVGPCGSVWVRGYVRTFWPRTVRTFTDKKFGKHFVVRPCGFVRVRGYVRTFWPRTLTDGKTRIRLFCPCGSVWVRGYVRTFFATDTHGRKDKNKAFFVGVGPCESVAISVTYFLQWLVLFRNE